MVRPDSPLISPGAGTGWPGLALLRGFDFSDLRAFDDVDQTIILFVTRELIEWWVNPREWSLY
jgi:hypothetical protein